MNVSNHGCIQRLSMRTLRANRTRNIVAVLAIALTTLLFTSLFTIALSINEGFQQSNFRQAGGWAHGSFKHVTQEQCEELQTDPLIKQWGMRQFLGMPTEIPFNKSHVEISYCDATEAHWMFCDPVKGRLPEEGTNEAATDTRVLELLGVTPELGTEFTLTFNVDGQPTTQTFTLCGWWEYDEATVASHVLIPQSRLNAILDEVEFVPPADDGLTGIWNLDIMLESSLNIRDDMQQILENHGYQSDTAGDDYILIGVNWGYTGAQLSTKADPMTVAMLCAGLLLIILTGYLIIYNVFQISVTQDIQFYGLLKTVGTTPRQLRRIIRIQALLLSLAGIPLGLVLGWLAGSMLVPVIISQLNQVTVVVSANPILFILSALFALATVFLSTRRPGRMAAKVSPIEALRYTEGSKIRTRHRRTAKKVSLFSMAWANLGRSRGKTVITVLSLSLAVVLLNITVIFTNGFDMDKYLRNMPCDFQVAAAGYFQTGNSFSPESAVTEDFLNQVTGQEGITDGGRTYGCYSAVEEFITEEYYRSCWEDWYSPEELDSVINYMNRTPDGLLIDTVQLYGMEKYPLDKLTLLEGDISKLYEPGGNYIAAVYQQDDYGGIMEESQWAKLGDTITLRYVDEYEYYYTDNGEIIPELNDTVTNSGRSWAERAVKYHDEQYTVAALVSIPNTLSYRYFGRDEFILNAQTLIRDTGTDSILYYAFDAADEQTEAIENFLQDYTENVYPQFDYESKTTYAAQFESFRNMFMLLGGALSFIVGLVGILNFFNAILTGISARRREFAVLQSIGMTSRQLKTLLILEGLLYTVGSIVFSLAFILIVGPFMAQALENIIWFFSYRFTILPVLVILPFFVVLGVVIPDISCHAAQKHSVVERLRQE